MGLMIIELMLCIAELSLRQVPVRAAGSAGQQVIPRLSKSPFFQ